MKLEEAINKWCPMIDSLCVGSQCMAWKDTTKKIETEEYKKWREHFRKVIPNTALDLYSYDAAYDNAIKRFEEKYPKPEQYTNSDAEGYCTQYDIRNK